MGIVIGILRESVHLLNQMSVYLIFGFLFGGIIHIFLQEGMIAKHLGKNDFLAVIKAALFGIPLPLCSCGVVPASLTLRKEGASQSSILSFLITTPTTGIDSIFASYALLGPFFTIFRILASFITGVTAGLFANVVYRNEEVSVPIQYSNQCKVCCHDECDEPKHHWFEKVKGVFSYAFGDLLKDVGKWLLIGILIGGTISYWVPDTLISRYLSSGWMSLVIMIIVGIPMYICSTGSIPIAAALMLKGMNPGAAFVFLMVGPATNSVALMMIANQFGKKMVFIFLTTIIGCSLLLGMLLNGLWQGLDLDILGQVMQHGEILPKSLKVIASIILVVSIAYHTFNKKGQTSHS